MQSMTGYGRGQKDVNGVSVIVEMKSVNSRSMEVSIKMPASDGRTELKLRNILKINFFRGRFDVTVNTLPKKLSSGKFLPVEIKVSRYLSWLRRLKRKFKLDGEIDIKTLLPFISEFIKNEDTSMTLLKQGTFPAFNSAIKNLIKSRKREGLKILNELKKSISRIKKSIKRISKIHPEFVNDKKKNFFSRATHLFPEEKMDNSRLEQEFALWLEKRDFSEEIQRLNSHIAEFEKLLTSREEPKGKKLDFFIQEMLREAGTLSAKANQHKIIQRSIDIKTELERMREQVQNVE